MEEPAAPAPPSSLVAPSERQTSLLGAMMQMLHQPGNALRVTSAVAMGGVSSTFTSAATGASGAASTVASRSTTAALSKEPQPTRLGLNSAMLGNAATVRADPHDPSVPLASTVPVYIRRDSPAAFATQLASSLRMEDVLRTRVSSHLSLDTHCRQLPAAPPGHAYAIGPRRGGYCVLQPVKLPTPKGAIAVATSHVATGKHAPAAGPMALSIAPPTGMAAPPYSASTVAATTAPAAAAARGGGAQNAPAVRIVLSAPGERSFYHNELSGVLDKAATPQLLTAQDPTSHEVMATLPDRATPSVADRPSQPPPTRISDPPAASDPAAATGGLAAQSFVGRSSNGSPEQRMGVGTDSVCDVYGAVRQPPRETPFFSMPVSRSALSPRKRARDLPTPETSLHDAPTYRPLAVWQATITSSAWT